MNKIGFKDIISYIGKVLSLLALVILFIACLFLVFYISTNIISRKNGKYPLISMYTIVSPSMEPNIMVYDVIFETRVRDEDDIKIGDVITFYSNSLDTGGYTVTHRVYKIIDEPGQKKFITKGDNNQREDTGYITIENIVGKVFFKIPQLGRIQFFISSRLGWLLIILIPAVSIITLDIFKLKRIYKIKKQIEVIPKFKEVEKIREKEENKKIRALLEKAERFNKK